MRSTPQIFVMMIVTLSLAGATELSADPCVPGAETLCLLENRFSVEVPWEDFDTNTGNGQVLPQIVDDSTGFFYYDDTRYLDLMIKVLDGCAINNRYWVFAVGLSDYLQAVIVTDTATDIARTYNTPLGDYPYLLDTDAFATCPAVHADREETTQHRGDTVLELVDGRFLLEVNWSDVTGDKEDGIPVGLTSHSGYFWFFTKNNPELAVKMFDGSDLNGHFWVNFGATNDLDVTLQVTDTLCQTTRTYASPLGVPAAPVSDRTAFPNCSIFEDGFESGDVSAWSNSVP